MGLNSSNSSKPPSSEGLRKPRKPRRGQSPRGGSDKPSGGQPGHPGTTLRQTADPDHIETHRPARCAVSGAPLTAADSVRGPVQYGPRIQAMAVYLQNWHLLPEDRLAELFRDLHGVDISAATLANITRQAADSWRACSERIRDLLVAADGPKHLDETGFRITACGQWLHVICTRWLTFYRTSERRGSLLEGLRGCLVHDHWKPYFTVPDVQHALCNAHHLRELEALAEIDGEAWARPMQDLLRMASRAAGIATEEGWTLPPELVAWFEQRYDRWVAEGLEPLRPAGKGRKGRPEHNLALRFRDFRTETLRFLHEPGVPFTNNHAERDLRMMKLRMKISGAFRSAQGTANFATLRRVLSTAQKQGRNRIEALMQGPAVVGEVLRDGSVVSGNHAGHGALRMNIEPGARQGEEAVSVQSKSGHSGCRCLVATPSTTSCQNFLN